VPSPSFTQWQRSPIVTNIAVFPGTGSNGSYPYRAWDFVVMKAVGGKSWIEPNPDTESLAQDGNFINWL